MKKIFISIYERFKKIFYYFYRSIKTPRLPINAEGKVYLNLGCGLNSGGEFVNIDVSTLPNIHYIHDIKDLSMFPDRTVDLIYASHVLEHIPRELLLKTLKEWYRVLKNGGVLRISVPDFGQLIKVYQENNEDVFAVQDQILGKEPPYNNHYTLWNFERVRDLFLQVGFFESNIKKWLINRVDHHDFVDRSSRHIRGDKEDIFISLNVEAFKV